MSRPVGVAVALIGIVSVLRALAAFNFPLTTDEAYYWTWSLHPAFGYTDHPPLVAWLIALGSPLGHTYGAVRLPFVVAEAVAALAAGRAAALLTGDARAGAYAAIAFTLIPQTKLEFAESIPDGAYMLAWALVLWAAAAVARRASPGAVLALGGALAAVLYARTFGWALVAGIAAWAVFARRDRLGAVALACAIAIVAYVPFLQWNATHGWETFAFEFVHRQQVSAASFGGLFDASSVRTFAFGVLIVAATWFVALRRAPRLPLVAWTALPLPLALVALSFAMRTETYWILGPVTSLALGCGVWLARAAAVPRAATLTVLGIAAALSFAPALFLPLPEGMQAAAFRAVPALRAQFSSGVYAYAQLAAAVRGDAAAGRAILTDRYETSAELLWYGVPSFIVGPAQQIPQWRRWYGPAAPPAHAVFVAFHSPFSDMPGEEAGLRAAYARIGTPVLHAFRYAGEPENTFYFVPLDDPRPDAQRALPGI